MHHLRILLCLVLWLALAAQSALAGPSRRFVLYGDDSRLEYYEIQDPMIRALARSTVTLVPTSSLVSLSADEFLGIAETWSQAQNYCPDERYSQQTALGFCSGTLIAPQLVLTAGHCLPSPLDCAQTALVFDYQMESPAHTAEIIAKQNVYHCARVLLHSNTTRADYAVVELDRPVTNRPRIPMSDREIRKDTPVFMLGYPMGIPLKYVSDAKVRKVLKNVFHSNLDAFMGNSGSPVFNQNTYELIGILVAGEDDVDYDTSHQCNRTRRCTNGGCKGETVMKVDVIRKKLGL